MYGRWTNVSSCINDVVLPLPTFTSIPIHALSLPLSLSWFLLILLLVLSLFFCTLSGGNYTQSNVTPSARPTAYPTKYPTTYPSMIRTSRPTSRSSKRNPTPYPTPYPTPSPTMNAPTLYPIADGIELPSWDYTDIRTHWNWNCTP